MRGASSYHARPSRARRSALLAVRVYDSAFGGCFVRLFVNRRTTRSVVFAGCQGSPCVSLPYECCPTPRRQRGGRTEASLFAQSLASLFALHDCAGSSRAASAVRARLGSGGQGAPAVLPSARLGDQVARFAVQEPLRRSNQDLNAVRVLSIGSRARGICGLCLLLSALACIEPYATKSWAELSLEGVPTPFANAFGSRGRGQARLCCQISQAATRVSRSSTTLACPLAQAVLGVRACLNLDFVNRAWTQSGFAIRACVLCAG
eukprot:6209485-Pleurochrysis_carterae.AAC.2